MKYLFQKYSDKFWMWVANLMPRKLVMWCFFRVVAHATTGKWGYQIVPDLTAMDAINRWGEKASPEV